MYLQDDLAAFAMAMRCPSPSTSQQKAKHLFPRSWQGSDARLLGTQSNASW